MILVQKYVKGIAGGIAAAIAFAIPVVDDGLVASEALGICGAFLAGLGIVALSPRNRDAYDV